MDVFLSIVLLIVGMALLIKGADFFVDWASQVAKAMKIPSLIIGLTLVSIGTSMPEMSVSIQSAIQNLDDMSFGNVVGSNIFNTFVVIGASALFTTLTVSNDMKKYDIPILIGIYLILILFGFVIGPFEVTLIESILILSLLFIYTFFLIYRSRKEKSEEENTKQRKWYFNVLFIILGLAGIIFGGDLVVDNAVVLATKLGMSELLVGLTIVAVGTSLPELVTSMVAAKKGENDIAVGNAIGSSIFNIILILGLSGIISPYAVGESYLIDLMVMLCSAVIILIMSMTDGKIGKGKGIILIMIYALYLTYIILRNMGMM